MNGSRSQPLPMGERSSIDALNRTIQGLEARIEGLITPRTQAKPAQEKTSAYDSVSEILHRQRTLDKNRIHSPERVVSHAAHETSMPRDQRPVMQDVRQRPAGTQYQVADTGMNDIAQALVSLRQELKKDIANGVSREVGNLRAELRSITSASGDSAFAIEMKDDLARLADSIAKLSHQASPADARDLQREFDDLRSAIDGLARQDQLAHMQASFSNVEKNLEGFNAAALQDDLLTLAYQLDDIKAHLGAMGSSPAIQALESRLISIASDIETLGNRPGTNERVIVEQFAGLDLRLDEISRAIAAASRSSASQFDPTVLSRFESQIDHLASQIDSMSRMSGDNGVSARIEALAERVEDLVGEATAVRLEERIAQLSKLLEQSQRSDNQPHLAGFLSDISARIDAMDHGAVNHALEERLDYLARRIDDMVSMPSSAIGISGTDTRIVARMESRLDDIVSRLDGQAVQPPAESFHSLERQIANLTSQLNAPRSNGSAIPAEFENRMMALEDYMATSDEFIMEAARQAAEAVAEAYSRNSYAGSNMVFGAASPEISALTQDLRALEDLTRSSEERTHQTFEALHSTLVQIADRLGRMETGTERPSDRSDNSDVRSNRYDYPEYHPELDPFLSHGKSEAAAVDTRSPLSAILARDASETARMPRVNQHELESAEISSAHLDGRDAQFANIDRSATPVARVMPETREPNSIVSAPQASERTTIEPPPRLDTSDLIEIEDFNLLLEPGSGAPDVKKILAKVRATKTTEAGTAESEKADFISAARRAAQAAAADVDSSDRITDPSVSRIAAPKAESGLAKHRRVLLLSAGFVLLGVMSYPLVNTFTGGQAAPAGQAFVEQPVNTTTEPAEPAAVIQPVTSVASPEKITAPAKANDDVANSNSDTNANAAPLTASPGGEAASSGENVKAVVTANAENGMITDPVVSAPNSAAAAPVAAPDVPASIGPASLVDAARKGDVIALFEVAARYTEGRSVKADLAEAAKWYTIAADKGFAPAQYRLATFYEKGTGVARDTRKARHYYEMAAEQGNASAMHNLAVLAATGVDLSGNPDMVQAAKWFQKAADLGIKDSQFNLAILYARGNGVAQNLEESYKWFSVAAMEGDKDAAQKRDEVAAAMQTAQLESAKAKATAWKKQPLNDTANSVTVPDEWAGKSTKTASVDMSKAITNIQAILNNNGFDAGKPDGKMGAKTVTAIKAFQKSIGEAPTGEITDTLVKALLERNR